MEIHNPRRILAVSLADSAQYLSDLIKDLTGTHPTPSPTPPPSSTQPSPPSPDAADSSLSLAGTTHPLRLTTPYYTATVPIWLDLIASPSQIPSTSISDSSPVSEWSAAFLSPEAKEVLEVLGGVVVVFKIPPPPSAGLGPASSDDAQLQASNAGSAPGDRGKDSSRDQTRELVRHVGKVVREGLGGWEWDGVGLAVGVGGSLSGDGDGGEELDEWEDLCAECGLEFVHVPTRKVGDRKGKDDGDKRNQFGERTGIARVLEALQANDWAGPGAGLGEDEEEGGKGKDGDDDEDDDGEFDPESLDFGFAREDFVGLRKAIWGGGGDEGPQRQGEDEELGDEDVQKLERMMLKLQAVRDATAGLPEEQRKRMAKRAVGEVMKEM